MDYSNALLDDFGSDSDASDTHMEEHGLDAHPASAEDGLGANIALNEAGPQTLKELLRQPKSASIESRLRQVDASHNLAAADISQVSPLIPHIRAELAKYAASLDTDFMDFMADIRSQNQSEEYRFLVELSDLPPLISSEISAAHKIVSSRYKVVFPELEALVASPLDYCRIVLEIGQDLVGIRAHEPQLEKIVSRDKVLSIVMAALQQFPSAFELSARDLAAVAASCQLCIDLSSFLGEVSSFIASKLAKYAPNVAALVGPVVASQLLIATGSLSQLAATPACNIASFGVRDLSSQKVRSSGGNTVRATGYVFQSPLITQLPPETVKQALRILSAKVVLAARVDLSRTSPDGSMGQKWYEEVVAKIDKLLAPPELTATKALPVPKEQKSKKRGGRRFRNMKQRFQMSELRKAQNKMGFGSEEQHVTDAFGEEIGLGMSRQLDGVSVNRNTDARMSKSMISRLQQQKERETLDTILLAPVGEKRVREEEQSSAWGTMKRQRVEEEDEI